MGTIEFKKIWVSLNTLLTSVNLLMLSIFLSVVIPEKLRSSKVPLIANAMLLMFITVILTVYIK